MKYIHVHGDNGKITVQDSYKGPDGDYGWVYEVPDGFEIGLTLDKMNGLEAIHELFIDHPGMKLLDIRGG